MELRAEEISQIIKEQIKDFDKKVELSETGVVLSVGDGIARVYGLEKVMAMAMSLNSCPASSWMNMTGTKTATVVAVEARTAPHTSDAPS